MTNEQIKKIPCEVFSRVVGYYRPVQNFNNGKKEEFGDRTFFDLEKNETNPNLENIQITTKEISA